MTKKITLIIFALITVIQLSAQTADNKWAVGLHGGKNEYSGDLGNGLFNFDQAFYGFGGLTVGRYFSKSFDANLYTTFGSFGFFKSETERFVGNKLDPAIIFSYKLSNGIFFSEDSKLVPSLNFGIGGAFYFGDNIVSDGFDILIPVGLGLKYNLSDNFAIQAYTFSNIINSDRRDGKASIYTQHDDHYFRHSLGLIYNFGPSKDASIFSQSIEAEPEIEPAHKWFVGIYGGKTEYSGDYGNALFKFGRAFYGFGGLSLGRYIDKNFDVNLMGTFGSYGYLKTPSQRFLGNLLDANVFLSYKLTNGYIFKENAKLVPTFNFGVGAAFYSGDDIVSEGHDWVIPIGLGLKYNVNDNLAIQAYTFSNTINSDNRDGFASTHTDYNDHFFKHSIGLVYSFGKSKKDSDKDGVTDDIDKCPNTPKGVAVDEFGCPIDTDGDGVPDYLDKCPNTPKGVKVDADGCPVDSDGDGVADYLDKCPNTPKGVKVDKDGCPVDSDGDGVPDYLDKCPNTPKGVKVDKDGCPIEEKPVIKEDRTEMKQDVVPVVKEDRKDMKQDVVTVKFDFNNVMFDKNSAEIKPENNANLDRLVKLLNDNPKINIVLSGHTCNDGSDDINNRLSKQRADQVRRYLTSKGIKSNRITVEHFGSTKPVVSNDTEENKIRNRRVEIKEKK